MRVASNVSLIIKIVLIQIEKNRIIHDSRLLDIKVPFYG